MARSTYIYLTAWDNLNKGVIMAHTVKHEAVCVLKDKFKDQLRELHVTAFRYGVPHKVQRADEFVA